MVTRSQDELAVRVAYDEVADSDVDPLPVDRAQPPLELAMVEHFAALPRVIGVAYRALRPGGLLLVAFQSGRGIQDVSASYRRRGHRR